MIDRTWTADGSGIDPVMQGSGPAAIDIMLAGVQERFPAYEVRLAGPVDKRHHRVRCARALYPPEGNEPFIAGVEFGTVDGEGRLRRITGFIDVMPGLQRQRHRGTAAKVAVASYPGHARSPG